MGARRLVAEYRPRLETAARLLCGDAHKAEDLVFRAFERAISRIDEFRPTGSFYYWIYTILLNLHRMDVRKPSARNEVVVAQESMPEVEDESARNPFEAFTFRGSAEAVRTAVNKLPENYREVVVLRYFEELTTPRSFRPISRSDLSVRRVRKSSGSSGAVGLLGSSCCFRSSRLQLELRPCSSPAKHRPLPPARS